MDALADGVLEGTRFFWNMQIKSQKSDKILHFQPNSHFSEHNSAIGSANVGGFKGVGFIMTIEKEF